MCISTPSIPDLPPPPPARSPEADEKVKRAVDRERKRMAAAVGRSDTILTGGKGLSKKEAKTVQKMLLGS